MKILQVSPAYYPAISIGGPIFSMLELEKQLIAEGHFVDTLTTHLGLTEAEKQQQPLDSIINCSEQNRRIYKRFYGHPHYTFSPSTLIWLMRHVNEYDVVLINGIWNFPILAAAIACRIRNVPYFIFPHGTLSVDAVSLKRATTKAVLLALFVRRIVKGALRVVFTTRMEERKVLAYIGGRVNAFVLPNMVDSKEFQHLPARGNFRARFGVAPDVTVLLHYGRVAKVKGVIDSVRALAAVRERIPNILYVIAGGCEPNYRQEIEIEAKTCGVSENIFFTGLLERSEGLRALVDADLFILPSVSENFGMAVVEAMLCELPVLISDNVGISFDVGKARAGAVVTLTPDGKALASAIVGLLLDETALRVLGQAGRRFALENYDTPAVRSQLLTMLALV
ncbi:MAG: glycosyltransferase [Glaciimonas sp.]|nr:glycosyltransferase [Glaciimonas sp.]